MTAPRVDFYILPDATEHGRQTLACKLAEKAYGLGHKIYIHAADPMQARQLDELLWTFKQNSFVPHALYPPAADESAPVLIGDEPEPDWSAEVLINLADTVPAGYQRVQRVIELVDQHAPVLNASRTRFRFYREHGLEPDSHKL